MAGPSLVCVFLDDSHDLSAFSCGDSTYDTWLTETAHRAHAGGFSTVYIVAEEQNPRKVLAYFTFTNDSVSKASLPRKFQKGAHGFGSLPSILVGRLARDESVRGILPILMALILQTAVAVARGGSAARIVTIDAANEALADKYSEYGFVRFQATEDSATVPLLRFIEDIENELAAAEAT